MAEQKSHREYADIYNDDELSASVGESGFDGKGPERALRAITANVVKSEHAGSTGDASGRNSRSSGGDWTATLELVKEACDSIRISEERVASLEAELEQVSIRSRDDLKNMNARLLAAQEEVKAANSRVRTMELMLAEAEDWASKINEAVVEGFGPYVRRMHLGNDDASVDV